MHINSLYSMILCCNQTFQATKIAPVPINITLVRKIYFFLFLHLFQIMLAWQQHWHSAYGWHQAICETQSREQAHSPCCCGITTVSFQRSHSIMFHIMILMLNSFIAKFLVGVRVACSFLDLWRVGVSLKWILYCRGFLLCWVYLRNILW